MFTNFKSVTAYGKEWVSFLDFGNGYHIAALANSYMPAILCCIYVIPDYTPIDKDKLN
jgi:hypothetical protein